MRAALIATGNEIVSGQIVNTNASLLADLLSGTGLGVAYHLAVPDNDQDLVDALDFLKARGVDHIFTIGGLGPTRDDLTRKIVAEYLNKGFSFHEDLWLNLEELLVGRRIEPREGHKWQCYFPEDSTVLLNFKGTAHGFRTQGDSFDVWCLPGPPEELISVYDNGIKPWLDQNIKKQTELFTWQCIGLPESDLAHKVEEVLEGCSYELGFRASPPIVEVKLWVPIGDPGRDAWLTKVENLVEKNLYSKNGRDYLREILDKALEEEEAFAILDSFSKNHLFQSVQKSYGGESPAELSFGMGDIDSSLPSLRLNLKGGEFIIELRASKSNFETSWPVDLLKYQRSRRYRVLKVAEALKDLHKKYVEN